MTVLMFSHDPDVGVIVVMDTLATSDGEPHMFMSKVTAFPHARMIVAGTGLGALITGWVNYLATQRVFRDVVGAVGGATEVLRRLHAEVVGDLTGLGLTATIYNFGVERSSGRVVRYIYRSTEDFAEERYDESGFGIKPEPEGSQPWGAPDAVDDYVALAERVRGEQDQLGGERIYIGGELIMTILTPAGIQTMTIHEFDGYEADWEAAMLRTEHPFAD